MIEIKTEENNFNNTVNKIEIEDDLVKNIFLYKNECYSSLEQAIYLYIRLCELNQNEESYNVKCPLEGKKYNTHFLLFAKILNQIEIPYVLTSKPSIKMSNGEYDIEIDENFNLNLITSNEVTKEKFTEKKEKIANDIKRKREIKNNFQRSLELYSMRYKKQRKTLKEKLVLLLKAITKEDTKGIDQISYTNKIAKNILGEKIKIFYIKEKEENNKGIITVIELTKTKQQTNYVIDYNQQKVFSISKKKVEEMLEKKYIQFNEVEENLFWMESSKNEKIEIYRKMVISKMEKDKEKYSLIKEILENDNCFFEISVDISYSILLDLGIDNEDLDEVYLNLIKKENYSK